MKAKGRRIFDEASVDPMQQFLFSQPTCDADVFFVLSDPSLFWHRHLEGSVVRKKLMEKNVGGNRREERLYCIEVQENDESRVGEEARPSWIAASMARDSTRLYAET